MHLTSRTAALRFCTDWKILPVLQMKSPENLGFNSRSLRRIFSSTFASFDLPFQVEKPSLLNKIGLSKVLSSTPVLSQWTSASPMKSVRNTSQQRASFDAVWRHTEPACWRCIENHCSTSGIGALQRCSNRMLHSMTIYACLVPRSNLADIKAICVTFCTEFIRNCHL